MIDKKIHGLAAPVGMSGEQVTPASKKTPATIRDCWGFMPKLVAGDRT
ncbi:hypothetical protein [Mesorhizobium sp. AA22]|nr:hypothetical protein [Mesorhizobium sp. AA22]QIA21709.1 hypothetical protein A9K68_007715 [Mesorhizobium sp. AA22]